MRSPNLLDNPPPSPVPSVRWSRFLESRYLSVGGLAAGGVAAIVGASVALAMLMPYVVAPDAAASNVSVVAANPSPVAPKPIIASPANNGVQYVGDVKQTDRPCEEQTWPYIAAHCLKPASEPKPETAKVAVDRSELKTVRAGLPSPAETSMVPQPEQRVVAARVPEIAASAPAARPARQAARDQAIRDDAQPKRSRSASARAGEPRDIRTDIRPDARAEARRAYASDRGPSDRNPSPMARRWTEAEYDVPDRFGGTRRVMVIRTHSIHQAAAFSDER
jgi:hypothetical protein